MTTLLRLFISIIILHLTGFHCLTDWFPITSVTNQLCFSNKDCQQENYLCENFVCKCMPNLIEIGGKCLPKIKPGQSPCIRDEQCQSTWPDTRCINTICQCTTGNHVITRDGIICVEKDSCPTGGRQSILKDVNNTALQCYSGQSALTFGCGNQLHMYDCLQDEQTSTSYRCCPNKANACNQPMDSGKSVSSEENEVLRIVPWYLMHSKKSQSSHRWYMDKASGECRQFSYLGVGGNANNFHSKSQCENYCKTTCPRGNPMFQQGSNGQISQFSQRQQMCNPKVGCGNPQYNCTSINEESFLCCPTTEFICSEYGGVTERNSEFHYDEGIFCDDTKIITQRYYFDRYAKQCLPFEYKGCGGTFNNFQTKEECEKYCLAKTKTWTSL